MILFPYFNSASQWFIGMQIDSEGLLSVVFLKKVDLLATDNFSSMNSG